MEDGARLIGRIDMDNAPSVPTVNVAAPGSLEPAASALTDAMADSLLTRS